MPQRGILVVLSGPSGTGKGTICQALRQESPIRYSISATTRKPREGEQHGREYFFLEKAEFEDLMQHDGLLEWAQVYDNFYGTPRKFVEEVLNQGEDCILEIDPQGAMQIRKTMPEAVLIFVAPPSLEELEKRITGRGTESIEEINKRLSCATAEMGSMDKYDYVIINDTVSEAVKKMQAILLAEKCRVSRNQQLTV